MTKAQDRPLLVTGAAGFIGFHVARRLMAEGHRVIGFDNLNDYYDPHLKEARLKELQKHNGFEFVRGDLSDRDAMAKLFAQGQFHYVIHLVGI